MIVDIIGDVMTSVISRIMPTEWPKLATKEYWRCAVWRNPELPRQNYHTQELHSSPDVFAKEVRCHPETPSYRWVLRCCSTRGMVGPLKGQRHTYESLLYFDCSPLSERFIACLLFWGNLIANQTTHL